MAWSQEAPQTDPGTANLGEVVVTAQRRSENLQRAAASVSVRTGQELEAEGKYTLSAILEDIPGVTGGAATFAASSPGSSAGTDSPAAGLNFRGIPSNTGIGGSSTAVATSAAIYVDGVYSGVGGSYDINRVEVLRGPQGTLYGRSATTGVVTVRTNDPGLSEFGFNATAEAGNHDLRHVTGAVNVPIIDGKLGLRLAGNYFDRDGYFSAGDAITNKDLRAKLLYQPTEDLSVLLGYAQQDNTQHSGGVTFNVSATDPESYIANPNPIGDGENAFKQYWAEFNWSLGDMTLTYIPAFRTWESVARNIAIIAPPAGPFPGLGADQIITTPTDEFITHELRLASGTGSRLTWQAG
ncbi:TonB-dependent receptor plug domain-containing protein [Brevundimonas sp. NIBR10]|uniref:TonB-dependent receptor n=1 Tax=Brevundimonas sp. NIBR10 TaxID=3015997 RepID=UPI0022F175A5|nr:TonB-dependent receptor plug domain-containing protein [Brevundimonas sp. NIBR10]